MKDYASMSDEQIAVAVAGLCTIEGVSINEDGMAVRNVVDDSPGSYSGGDYIEFDFDPCNNPADAWPILLEHHIAVVPFDGSIPWAWPAGEGLKSKHLTEDENPLRAGMIVFLKMMEARK